MKTSESDSDARREHGSSDDGGTAPLDDSLAQLLRSGRRHSRFRRVLLVLVLLAVAAAAGFGVFQWKKGRAAEEVPRYVTEPLTKGDLTSTISATGTVEALNTVEVGAEISGRILSLNADFNDAVSAGQVLAEIDPEQHKAAVAQAKAQMLAAQAQVAEAEATLIETQQESKRAADLSAKGLLSSKELEGAQARAVRAEASLKSARASAALAKASFDAARSKLSKTEIVCPISGTVLSREVEVGQTINAGMQTPVLFIIAEDLKTMRLSSRVDEADIGKVFEGQTATFTVDAYAGREFASSVMEVRNVPQNDQNVVSYEVLLSVDNQEMLLKPGMTASVEIVTEKLKGVLLVPNKALRFSPPKGEGFRFRGPPVPFLGRSGNGRSGKGKKTNPMQSMGKIKGNQGVLWKIDRRGPPGALSPVKVDKLASDGIRTAVHSEAIKERDEVVVEQPDSVNGKP
jgi:HlyD family secretion protein